MISIAIILQGIQAARKKRTFPRKTSATLVVVPPGLIDQWKREVKKFTNEMPNVICIYDATTILDYTLKDIIEADMVVCPVDLLEAKGGYMARLARIAAGVKNAQEVPQLPKETGQVEKNGAAGVWIPATSQDPFGGANNPRSQQRRNESAYFTYVYHDYIRYVVFVPAELFMTRKLTYQLSHLTLVNCEKNRLNRMKRASHSSTLSGNVSLLMKSTNVSAPRRMK